MASATNQSGWPPPPRTALPGSGPPPPPPPPPPASPPRRSRHGVEGQGTVDTGGRRGRVGAALAFTGPGCRAQRRRQQRQRHSTWRCAAGASAPCRSRRRGWGRGRDMQHPCQPQQPGGGAGGGSGRRPRPVQDPTEAKRHPLEPRRACVRVCVCAHVQCSVRLQHQFIVPCVRVKAAAPGAFGQCRRSMLSVNAFGQCQ